MSKIIHLQDFHITGSNSCNYIGNYFEDSLLMLDEILSIAKENKVEAILDGGDFYDAPEPSYRILDEIANRFEEAKISMYSLFGNHCTRYHSVEHGRYTGLAHLIKRSKYFNYLTDLKTKDYHIKAIEYSHEVEEEIKKNGIDFTNDDVWKIAIVHAFICPKKFPYASHVVCSDIKTNADLVLCAHYHAQWEKTIGNTRFLDIGCLGRTSITEHKVEPSIVLLDTENRSVEVIKLKSAKPGKEVFDLTKVDEKKAFDQGIDKFIRSIESADFQATNIEDNIKFIGKEKKVEKKVIDLIIDKIKELGVKDE